MSNPPTPDPRLAKAVESVVAALEKSDQPLAVRLARGALDDGLAHPLFLNLRAFWHEGSGRAHEALADLEHAHRLAPEDVPVLNALGLALARLQRHVDATKAFETATALQPDFVPAHFNHGWACEMWGELDRAQRSYEKAVALNGSAPGAAEPLARLAVLAGRRGDWDETRSLAARTLELSPAHPIAHLMRTRADIQDGKFEAADQSLRQILAWPKLSTHDRYEAMGALGDLRHRQERYADAFAAYQTGNAEYGRTVASRYQGSASALDAVRWMHRYYENIPPADALPHRSASASGEASCHVFLVGFIRSGTTLLEQVLASHPDVTTMEEKEALEDSGMKFLGDARGLDLLRGLSDRERDTYLQAYWRRVRELGFEPGGKIFVDKQPFNTVKLPLIAELFPQAKIIFAIRDPRDVLLSCMRRRFSVTALTYELLEQDSAARFYAAYMTLAERLMQVLPLAFHCIRHEDLVDDFEGEVGKVCDFLGIAWTDAMRDFAERRKVRAISSPSAAQIAKGLNREGIGQWRKYREQMAPILPVLQPWVDRFGYPAA